MNPANNPLSPRAKADPTTPSANNPFPITDHSTTQVKDTVFVYGGHQATETNRFFSLSGLKWKEIQLENAPKRSHHEAVAVGTKLFIIGGIGSDSPNLSVFRIDCSDPNAAQFPSAEVQLVGPTVPTRHGHSCIRTDNNQIIIYGGQNDNGVLDDCYSLNPETLEVKQISGQFPKSAYHSAVLHQGKMYVIGGYDGCNYSSDIFTWDTEKNVIAQVKPNTKHRFPAARAGHKSVLLPDHEILIYGGHSLEGCFTDFWIYKIEKKNWASCVLPPISMPTLRSGRSMNLIGHKILLLGGRDEDDAPVPDPHREMDIQTLLNCAQLLAPLKKRAGVKSIKKEDPKRAPVGRIKGTGAGALPASLVSPKGSGVPSLNIFAEIREVARNDDSKSTDAEESSETTTPKQQHQQPPQPVGGTVVVLSAELTQLWKTRTVKQIEIDRKLQEIAQLRQQLHDIDGEISEKLGELQLEVTNPRGIKGVRPGPGGAGVRSNQPVAAKKLNDLFKEELKQAFKDEPENGGHSTQRGGKDDESEESESGLLKSTFFGKRTKGAEKKDEKKDDKKDDKKDKEDKKDEKKDKEDKKDKDDKKSAREEKKDSGKTPRDAVKDQRAAKSGIQGKLGNFFANRSQLEMAPAKNVAWIPLLDSAIVTTCLNYLNQYKDTIGLFRIPGSASGVERLYAMFEHPENIALADEDNPHNVAGALKLYFRSLAQPVFPFELFEEAMELSQNYQADQDVQPIKAYVERLPPLNYSILAQFVLFLKDLTLESEVNKMDSENIGIVFGPTLLRQAPEKETPMSAMTFSKRSSNFVVYLIDRSADIFTK